MLTARSAFAAVLSALCCGVSAAQTVARYSTDDFTIALGANGTVTELQERTQRRNLLRWQGKFASVILPDGREAKCSAAARRADGRIELSFENVTGSAVLSVREEKWGLVFTAERLTVPDVKEFKFFILYPICRKYNGQMMNAMSDDESAVVLRTYELTSAMRLRGNTVLEAVAEIAEHPQDALPAHAALVVAPRAKVLDLVKKMSRDAGALTSRCGGAWSLDAPENRESYLIASLSRESVEDWIALAERGGFRTISLYNWWRTLGHYETNTNRYPRGDADLKDTIDRIHAAGLKVGMHTLTACIDFQDAWVRPLCHDNLLVTYAYTLARPFADGDSELFVNEKPGPKHDLETSFLSNGNNLRIGGELFTYTGVRGNSPPYAFTGVKRGARGTRQSGTIPAGARVEYLFQHFFSFFPEPSSPFMDEMAQRLAGIYSKFGFDFVYHDGAEPMSRYNVDLTRRKFADRLDQHRHPLQVEASIGGAHSWWFHSRIGAWDHVHWGAKQFHDYHLHHVIGEARNANMLAGQAGWWSLVKANGKVRGSFADEAEYFASRNAGADLAMSMDGVGVTKGPLTYSIERQMTIIGRYERFRLAGAFTDEAKRLLNSEGREFRLRQDGSGLWTLAPTVCRTHRAGTPDLRSWTFESNARKGALRIEALYSPVVAEGDILIGPKEAEALKVSAAPNVSAKMRRTNDLERGEVFLFRAENASGDRRGAWAGAGIHYAHPFRNIAKDDAGKAFGFWVKGDGSGTALDFRISSSRIHNGGQSDHFVTLDFKGWRYVRVLLRERDACRYGNYGWAGYRPIYPVYRNFMDPKRVEKIEFFLNDIPAGGAAEVCISPVEILAEKKSVLHDVAVVIGDVRYEVPFALESGEYAELEGRSWTHYSEEGTPIGAAAVKAPPVFGAGANKCRLEAPDAEMRAEVTLFSMDTPLPALKPISALRNDDRRLLSYEAVDPIVYAPSKGFSRPFAIATRPGETAALEFEIHGPVKNPSLEFRSADGTRFTVSFDVDVGEGERLICRDGSTWKVVRDFKAVQAGVLHERIPLISGVGSVRISSALPAAANARINAIKRYQDPLRNGSCVHEVSLQGASTFASATADKSARQAGDYYSVKSTVMEKK